MQRVVEIDVETKTTRKFTQFSLFSKSATDNLAVNKKTKSTSALLSFDKASAETEPEALRAAAEAFGVLVGTAAKTAK